MTTPETSVMLTLEKPGPQYRAKVLVRHDFGTRVEERSVDRYVATPDEAAAWARGIAQMAGCESVRLANRTGEAIKGWPAEPRPKVYEH